MAPFKDKLTGPTSIESDDDIEQWFRKTAITANHPCGTCAIGPVVDNKLRVQGTKGLRVVDASAIPTIISGHINACVLMMAEMASDLIRERALLPPIFDDRAASNLALMRDATPKVIWLAGRHWPFGNVKLSGNRCNAPR